MSYKKIIEKYAMEFSSPPVLCTMNESMETLEGRDEWALEADIFQARAAEKAKEKKVKNEKEKVEKEKVEKVERTALTSSSSSP